MSARAWALLALGLSRMAFDLCGATQLAGAAAATLASPAPKVFSSVRGLETYSTRFFLELPYAAQAPRALLLTPELVGALQGPYNRRNVYGALLSYGPVLRSDPRTRAMFESVARYALCGRAPLLRELGIAPEALAGPVRVRLVPHGRPLPEGMPTRFEAPCR